MIRTLALCTALTLLGETAPLRAAEDHVVKHRIEITANSVRLRQITHLTSDNRSWQQGMLAEDRRAGSVVMNTGDVVIDLMVWPRSTNGRPEGGASSLRLTIYRDSPVLLTPMFITVTDDGGYTSCTSRDVERLALRYSVSTDYREMIDGIIFFDRILAMKTEDACGPALETKRRTQRNALIARAEERRLHFN